MAQQVHSSIEQKLREMFARSLNIELPPDATDLISGGRIDSLALIELLFQIEVEFGVTPDFERLDIADFESLAAIEQLIIRSRTAQNSDSPGAL